MKFTHRHTNQDSFSGMQCYGTRKRVPKQTILSLYTLLAVIVPVIIPVPLVLVLRKIIPEFVRI